MIPITDLVKTFQAMRPLIAQYEKELVISSNGFFLDDWAAYYGPAELWKKWAFCASLPDQELRRLREARRPVQAYV